MLYISLIISFLLLILSFSLVLFTCVSYDTFLLFFNDLSLSLKNLYHFSFDLKNFYTAETHASAQKIGFWLAGIYAFFAFISWVFRPALLTYLSSLKETSCSFFKDLSRTLLTYWNELSLFEKFLLSFLIILGIGIRLIYVNQPLRGDEGVVFYSFAQHPWYIIVSAYNNVGNHIFHTLLMHVSCELFGNSLWAIRLPVIFSGIALLPLSFIVVRALSQKYIALLSTALISSSSALIEYSVNSRGYMVQILLMVVLVGITKYLIAHRNTFATTLFVSAASLSFWTVPTTFYIYGGICIWFFGNLLSSTSFKNTIKVLFLINFFVFTICLILYTPIFLANRGLGHMSTMISGHLRENIAYSYFIQALFKEWTRNWPQLFGSFSLLGIISALLLSAKEWKISSLFGKKDFLILPCIFWALASSFVIFNPTNRLWLVFAWVFYLSIAQGLWKILPRRFAPFIFTFLAITWVGLAVFNEYTHQYVYKNPLDSFQSAKEAALYLKDNLESHDLIYAASPTMMPLKYELEELGVKTFIPEIQINSTQISLKFLSPSKTSEGLLYSQRIWIVRSESSMPLSTILSKFSPKAEVFNSLTLVNQYENGALYILTLEE